MFLKRDHFKRKTVFQPAICHRICDFSGGSRWFWHQRFKFGDGSPTSPVPHTCLVSKRPDLVRWLKNIATGCMVPCENIQNLSPNLQTILKSSEIPHPLPSRGYSLTVLQSYLYVAPMFERNWRSSSWGVGAINAVICRVQCTRYRCPKCYGVNFYAFPTFT